MAEKPQPPQAPPMPADLSQRLKMVEERLINLRSRTEVMDQNFLEQKKKQSSDIKLSQTEIDEVRKELEELRSKMKMMANEVKIAAKDEDVQVIKRYLEYFQPVEFVTKKQVAKMVLDEAQNLGKIESSGAIDVDAVVETVMQRIKQDFVGKEELNEAVEAGIVSAFERMKLKEKILQYIKDHVGEVLGSTKK